MKEEILIKTTKEYYDSGNDEFEKKRYNSSVVLYFKALIAISDYIIYKKTGETPSSHTNRFRTTEKEFPEIYNLIDKDFQFYQDSYSQVMSKELAEVIKQDVQTLAKKTQIKI
jgi:hypothetical protein